MICSNSLDMGTYLLRGSQGRTWIKTLDRAGKPVFIVMTSIGHDRHFNRLQVASSGSPKVMPTPRPVADSKCEAFQGRDGIENVRVAGLLASDFIGKYLFPW